MPDHMTITPEQAGAALLSIEDASRHSAILLRYRRAAPFFILWGCCWALAYGLCNFYPNHMGVIWSVSDAIGILGSWRIMRTRPITARHHGAWRLMAAVAVVAAFVAASFSVLAPQSGQQVATFITLVFAAAYALFGIWAGWRLVVIGGLVACIALAAFFWADAQFNLWMGMAGGGGLVAVGFWLRRA